MNQTRREFLDDLLDFMGEQGDDLARNSAERVLNRVIGTIWLKHPWTDHRMPTPYQFATVADTRTYVLPAYFGRVAGTEGIIRNLTTGSRIAPANQDALEEDYPHAGTSFEHASTPQCYFLGGTQAVHTQPDTAGEALEVLSDNAADTTIVVTIEGLDANGVYTAVQKTLTGTVAVALGTFSQVINFSKAYPENQEPTTEHTSSAGSVTLRTTGGTELDVLQPYESAHERPTLTLFPKPDRVYQIAVPVIRAPKRLTKDSDEIPRFWGPALYEEARLEWALNQGELTYQAFILAPRPRLKELIEADNARRYAGQRLTPFQL